VTGGGEGKISARKREKKEGPPTVFMLFCGTRAGKGKGGRKKNLEGEGKGERMGKIHLQLTKSITHLKTPQEEKRGRKRKGKIRLEEKREKEERAVRP